MPNYNLLAQSGPTDMSSGFMQGEQQQNQLVQQQQDRRLLDIQVRNALRDEQNAIAEQEAAKGASSVQDLATRYRQAGLGKQAMAAESAIAKQKIDQLTAAKSQLELMKSSAAQILANPVSAAKILNRYGQLTGIDVSDDLAEIQSMGNDPDQIRRWAAGHALEAEKLLPKFETLNLHGGIVRQGFDPITGAPMTQGVYNQMQPLPSAVEAQKSRIAKAGASTINTMLPASEEVQKEYMKEARQTFSSLKQAPVVLDNIEKAKALVPKAKGFMGAGGESMQKAVSFLNNRLGTNIDTKGVTASEELRSRLFLGIMDNLKKLDSQPSQQQQEALQAALGSIGTDPSALPRVLDVFGEAVRQKVNLYNDEVRGAENRGVRFPYDPVIKLKSQQGVTASPPAGNAPTGIDPKLWQHMTPEERKLWQK